MLVSLIIFCKKIYSFIMLASLVTFCKKIYSFVMLASLIRDIRLLTQSIVKIWKFWKLTFLRKGGNLPKLMRWYFRGSALIYYSVDNFLK